MRLASHRPETLEYRLYGPLHRRVTLENAKAFAVAAFEGDGEPVLLVDGQHVTETSLLHFYRVTLLETYDALDNRAAARAWRRVLSGAYNE